MLDLAKTIVIDTETTGLAKSDEVISLAIINGFGERIFYDYIMPAHRRSWPKAEAVNGIGWEDVQGKLTIAQLAPYLVPLLEQADLIVGYNVSFDLRMLRQSGLDFEWVESYDVMRELAENHTNGRWLKLEEAARVFGYGPVRAHDALEDTRATLYLFWLLSGGGGHARFMRATCFEGTPVEVAAAEQEKEERRTNGCITAVKVAFMVPVIALYAGVHWLASTLTQDWLVATIVASVIAGPIAIAVASAFKGDD